MRRLDCNLRKAIRKHNVRQIEDCISIYKEKNYPFFVCKKQHYYAGRIAGNLLSKKGNCQKGKYNLIRILRLTLPSFDCNWNNRHYYTHLELLLIQMIIQCDIVLGEIEEARLLLEGMHDYSERLDMDWEKQEML